VDEIRITSWKRYFVHFYPIIYWISIIRLVVQDFAGPSVLYVVFTPRNPWSRLSTPTTRIIYLLFFNQFTPFPPILPSIVCIHFYILLYSIVSLFSGVYIYT
jgi:hypothetical protein